MKRLMMLMLLAGFGVQSVLAADEAKINSDEKPLTVKQKAIFVGSLVAGVFAARYLGNKAKDICGDLLGLESIPVALGISLTSLVSGVGLSKLTGSNEVLRVIHAFDAGSFLYIGWKCFSGLASTTQGRAIADIFGVWR